jgi:hypothetical protein
MTASPLALSGGPRAVTTASDDLFRWPIITEKDEAAALDVLRRGVMSIPGAATCRSRSG